MSNDENELIMSFIYNDENELMISFIYCSVMVSSLFLVSCSWENIRKL
jgi:hypothetical protein